MNANVVYKFTEVAYNYLLFPELGFFTFPYYVN